MTSEQFGVLAQEHLSWLEEQQLQAQFNIGDYERFDINPQAAELVFATAGTPRVIATIQLAGTLSTKSATWLWSWANDSTPDHIKQEILKVKHWGEQNGAFPLTNRGFEAGDTMCYSLTAICAKILDARGVYRAPGPSFYAYLVMTDVRWA